MSLFPYRHILRSLNRNQRRKWAEQRVRLSPRVNISTAYVPPNIARTFAYVPVAGH